MTVLERLAAPFRALTGVGSEGETRTEITIDELPEGLTIVRLAGSLELSAATALRERLLDLVATGRSRLVVTLNRLTYVDSTGVGALIAGVKAARLAGGNLRLAAPPEQLETILRIMMLDKVLPLYPTVAEALDGL